MSGSSQSDLLDLCLLAQSYIYTNYANLYSSEGEIMTSIIYYKALIFELKTFTCILLVKIRFLSLLTVVLLIKGNIFQDAFHSLGIEKGTTNILELVG